AAGDAVHAHHRRGDGSERAAAGAVRGAALYDGDRRRSRVADGDGGESGEWGGGGADQHASAGGVQRADGSGDGDGGDVLSVSAGDRDSGGGRGGAGGGWAERDAGAGGAVAAAGGVSGDRLSADRPGGADGVFPECLHDRSGRTGDGPDRGGAESAA